MVAPFVDGADHDTLSAPSEATTETAVGASGAAAGVTETGMDALDVPAPFVAVTVIEYSMPFVRPVRLHDNVVPLTSHVVGVSVPLSAVTK